MIQTDAQEKRPVFAPAKETSVAAARCPGRLRILHVLNFVGRGGTEFGVLKLMAGLDAEVFEHRLCAMRTADPEFVRKYQLDNILDVAGSADLRLQFPLFRLKEIFERHRPHIVHTRNWGALEAVLAARLARVPVVIHSEHGYEMDMLSGMALRRRVFRRFAYTMTDAVLTVTRELRDYHARQAWIRPERVAVMYNGVDTERFSPCEETRQRVRLELGISPSCFLIGGVGRMVAIKDYATLLRAAETIIGRGMDARVLLVGGGPELESLQKQAHVSVHLQGRVTFTGATDRIPELLNAMDAFVLPSFGEGMSNTLLEAMASGLPLLATRAGGNPEVVEEERTGFLFSPNDAALLGELLEKVGSNAELRNRLGAAAREHAMRHFSLDAMMRRYQELYRELAIRRGLLAK